MSLALESITKTVGRETHIDGVSMELAAGSFNVLLGLTLAGKTTLMRIMAGLDRPTRGRVRFNGRDVTGVPVRKRNVAMVYQEFINYPSMSCYDNIASPLKLAKMSRTEIDRRVRAEAERLHIEHLLERLPAELSGGQQQRLAMARALVRNADVLLLDEPQVNLDYKLRETLRTELRQIFAEREAVVVYATTDPMEALTLGGETAVLHEGRLVQRGATPHVYHNPASVVVSQVFSDPPMNILAARVDGSRLDLAGMTAVALPPHLQTLPSGDYRIGIRPAHMFVSRHVGDAFSIRGKVEAAEIAGSETYIHLRRGERTCIVQEAGVHNVEMSQDVEVFVDPRHLFAFAMDGSLMAAPQRRRIDRHPVSEEKAIGTH